MDMKKALEVEKYTNNIMNGMNVFHTARLSILYYYIFEEKNYHTLNNKLTVRGNFGKFRTTKYESGTVNVPLSYGTPYAEKLYKDYNKLR